MLLPYRSKIFELKTVFPLVEVIKVFNNGLKLMEDYKICKTYNADTEIIKKLKGLTLRFRS